jgi:hypothetical protein
MRIKIRHPRKLNPSSGKAKDSRQLDDGILLSDRFTNTSKTKEEAHEPPYNMVLSVETAN